MPQTTQIALLVLGAVLILIGIVGGNIKIFGAEVAEKVSNPLIKFTSLALGGLFIWLSLHPQNSIENRIFVDSRSPFPSPAAGVSVKKNDLVEVIPLGGFPWSCDRGNKTWVDAAGKGSDFDYPQRYMLPSAPFCSLIGRVGNGAWHPLGDKNTFTADDSGSLYLAANDVTPGNCPMENKQECYSDNKGTGIVTVNVRAYK